MPLTALAFLVCSSLYTGFQWTVRTVVYPQFQNVPAGEFSRYEQAHQRKISVTVGPLFVLLLLSAVAQLFDPASRSPRWCSVAAILLVLAILGVTCFLAVPLHRRLSMGFDSQTYARLLAVDTSRLLLAVASTVLAVVTAR